MINLSSEAVLEDIDAILGIAGEVYSIQDSGILLKTLKSTLARKYRLPLNVEAKSDKGLYKGVSGSDLELFNSDVDTIHANLSQLCSVLLYSNTIPVRLSDINYLAFTKDSMGSLLRLLMMERTMGMAGDAVGRISDKVVTMPMSLAKRYFVLLALTYDLELYYVTAVIAQILYIGWE